MVVDIALQSVVSIVVNAEIVGYVIYGKIKIYDIIKMIVGWIILLQNFKLLTCRDTKKYNYFWHTKPRRVYGEKYNYCRIP
ncbi:MAG: hypothetical protein AB9836_11755 [Aminipila sp.]